MHNSITSRFQICMFVSCIQKQNYEKKTQVMVVDQKEHHRNLKMEFFFLSIQNL